MQSISSKCMTRGGHETLLKIHRIWLPVSPLLQSQHDGFHNILCNTSKQENMNNMISHFERINRMALTATSGRNATL